MRALLLAAGEGTRLRPLTDTVPKAMVPVAGIPVLERNVRWLAAAGVTDLAINLHHLPEAVQKHFGDGSRLDVRIRWSYEPELLGTAGALAPLRTWLSDESFLVVYADNIITCSIAAMEAVHARLGAIATVALWEREDPSASGVAELDGERIVRFVEKPPPGTTESHWVSAGVIICEPAILGLVGEAAPLDFGHDVLPRVLREGGVLGGHRMGEGEALEWIDTMQDLQRVERAFRQNPLQ